MKSILVVPNSANACKGVLLNWNVVMKFIGVDQPDEGSEGLCILRFSAVA